MKPFAFRFGTSRAEGEAAPQAKVAREPYLAPMKACLTNAIYESTVQALDALYPKVQNGGYVIVDDYRAAHGIAEEMVEVDWSAVYWKLN